MRYAPAVNVLIMMSDCRAPVVMLQISLMEHDDFPDLTPPDPKPAAAPDAETRPVLLLATCHSTSIGGWSSRTLSLNYTFDQFCCDRFR